MCEACYISLWERQKAGKGRDQNELGKNKHGKIRGKRGHRVPAKFKQAASSCASLSPEIDHCSLIFPLNSIFNHFLCRWALYSKCMRLYEH